MLYVPQMAPQSKKVQAAKQRVGLDADSEQV